MSYENIKGAWRTRKQALKHILSELVGGRLGAADKWEGCQYEAKVDGVVKHCGVGCLFTPAQIRSIKMRGLNGQSIDGVEEKIGTKNLEAVTGLCMPELEEIQSMHDGSWETIRVEPKTTSLFKYLTKEIAKA